MNKTVLVYDYDYLSGSSIDPDMTENTNRVALCVKSDPSDCLGHSLRFSSVIQGENRIGGLLTLKSTENSVSELFNREVTRSSTVFEAQETEYVFLTNKNLTTTERLELKKNGMKVTVIPLLSMISSEVDQKQPPLRMIPMIRTLSEHHWQIAEEMVKEQGKESIKAGFGGPWTYVVKNDGNITRRETWVNGVCVQVN